MFNSFLDGTKSALEMSAVANGCDLKPPTHGLQFPPCGVHDLPQILKPQSEGGQLEKYGTVEVVSCLEKDGRDVFNHLRWGVYVIIEGKTEKNSLITLSINITSQHPVNTRKNVLLNMAYKQTSLADLLFNTNHSI